MRRNIHIVFALCVIVLFLIPPIDVNSQHTATNGVANLFLNQTNLSWNLEVLGVADVWQITQGSEEITIAVIDTGVEWNDHELLTESRWVNTIEENGLPGVDDDANGYIDDYYGWDFSDQDNSPHYASDGVLPLHATSIATVIAGAHDDDDGYGIAPNVKIMNLRVMDVTGSGRIIDIYDAIKYAVDQNASIISLSLYFISTNFETEAWNTLLQHAYSLNIAMVGILQRGGGGAVPFPASSEYVIATGSISEGLDPTSLDVSGPELELLAPGSQIPTIYPNGDLGLNSGTSFAAPHVAGTIALMRSIRDDLTLDNLRHTLHYGASDIDGPGWNQYSGYGVVNASKSVYAWQNFEILDFDGDGISNQEEIELGLLYYDQDSDGDKMPDNYELEKGFDPSDPSDGSLDFDGDGINNRIEYLSGSDPTDPYDPYNTRKEGNSFIYFSISYSIIAIAVLYKIKRK